MTRIRDPEAVEELIAAVLRYRRSLQHGMPNLVGKGAGSLEFRAEADRTAAAWQDVKSALAKLEEVE